MLELLDRDPLVPLLGDLRGEEVLPVANLSLSNKGLERKPECSLFVFAKNMLILPHLPCLLDVYGLIVDGRVLLEVVKVEVVVQVQNLCAKRLSKLPQYKHNLNSQSPYLELRQVLAQEGGNVLDDWDEVLLHVLEPEEPGVGVVAVLPGVLKASRKFAKAFWSKATV